MILYIRNIILFMAVVMTCSLSDLYAIEIGESIDVAPQIENSILQKWPRVAWSAESKCWLVVWREGDLCEQDTDIWCARVAVDGTILDPKGIRITTSNGVQDRPVVGSNGKGFLVAWQDIRNGKDWDVYATLVSGDGTVSDPDGFLIDGRPHSQCAPSVVGMKDNFYVAWQAWIKDGASPGYGSYEIKGMRVSPDGKKLDPDGIKLVGATALQPSLSFNEKSGLAMVAIGRTDKKIRSSNGFVNNPGVLKIDPENGTPIGTMQYLPMNKFTWDVNYVPAVALMDDGSVITSSMGWRGGMALYRFGKDGKVVDGFQRFRANLQYQSIAPISSLAFDGKRCFMTYDFPSSSKKRAKYPWRMKVWGWMLSADGKIIEGGQSGVAIAGADNMCTLQAVPCAGPEGTFIVVYAEVRAMEDTKLVARIVKPGSGN